ncbi:MAG: OB-fold nucleic acid binding domain-containing protein [Candidatus Nanoarchaeia archaeon]|nr:OB-fold nucleic acid binding domain-containing protein [Candidatus Nanoarchaeia archaeon]
MDIKRNTAYIFWIKDLASASPLLNESGFKVFNVGGKQVRRVNLIAAVVDSYENSDKRYNAFTLDDGSGQIRVKAWDEDTLLMSSLSIGDMALVVGMLHESNGEIFVRPEIVRKMSAEWAFARRQYLDAVYGKQEAEHFKVSEEVIEEPVEPSMEARGRVVSLISSYDGMVNVEELIAKAAMPAKMVERILDELIKDGEVFKPKAGFVQAL